MRKFFALSTSTLSGALVIVLLTVLLGDKVPWFIEKLHSSYAQVYSITVNVDDIFDDKSSANTIDLDKYHLDGSHYFYLRLPSEDWNVSMRDPGEFLKGLSVADIPFLHYTVDAMDLMSQTKQPQKGDVTTTTLSAKGSEHSISFTEKSKFDGVLLRANPFDDSEYANSTIRLGAKIGGIDPSWAEELLAGETDEARVEYKKLRDEMRAHANSIIEMNWPSEKLVQTAVTVTTFQPRLFSANPIAKLLEVRPEQSIFSLLGYLQFSNPEIMSLNMKNVAISSNNKVILFDATSTLENVLVDGKEFEKVELVKIFLIAIANDIIYVVNLKYLHGIGTTRQLALEAEQLFISFRLLI